ncbi:hypothetical protein AAHE18_12G042200 [Arachis hypogaea]
MIPDFIAELAKLPLLPPYLHPGNPDFTYGVNFASGGSGALLQTAQGYVIDLHTQVKYFKNVKKILREKIGDEEVEALLKRSVYFFNVGGNDYRGLLNVTNSTVRLLPIDKQQFVGFVIGNLTNAIKEIYEQGGRKFGFLNVGPIGCSPSIRILKNNGSTCFDEISAVARLHNIQLSKMTLKLKKQLNGFKYSVHDFYVSLSQVVTYPSKYGYKGGSGACCGSGPYRGEYTCGGNKGIKEYELCQNPNDYVFFDSHHPSDKACEASFEREHKCFVGMTSSIIMEHAESQRGRDTIHSQWTGKNVRSSSESRGKDSNFLEERDSMLENVLSSIDERFQMTEHDKETPETHMLGELDVFKENMLQIKEKLENSLKLFEEV